MQKIIWNTGVVLVFSLFMSGCAYIQKWIPAKKTPPSPPPKHEKTQRRPGQGQPKNIDSAGQQRYYDLGMKYYTEENYAEAKKAWQQVLQMGPGTPLAGKTREYLKKTDQILKTLQEIEKK